MSASLLSIEGLTLERGGVRLLHNFQLEVAAGDLVWVEGANGSGKTSLLRYLAGLSLSTGSGVLRRRAEKILYLGHKPAIKTALTARENLQWYCRGQGWEPAGIDAALEQAGLEGYEDERCHSLSAGQQRRVGLARLYLSDASLWLLDEPFTSIDTPGTRKLAACLQRHAGLGGAIVVTSHHALPLDYPLRRVSLEPGP